MIAKGTDPRQKLRMPFPRVASQCERYTTSANLATSAGWISGKKAPRWSQRADPLAETLRFLSGPGSGTRTTINRTIARTASGTLMTRR